jgi:hypothetical protein
LGPKVRSPWFLNRNLSFDALPKLLEGWFRKKIQMQGAQKLRSEAHLRVRRNDEVEAQRRRWIFYETIKFACA